MIGVLALLARGASYAARGAGKVTKAPVKTLPKTKKTGWGTYAKTGVIGGSVGAAGLGISSAVGSAQASLERGGGGALMVGGLALAAVVLVFLLMRGRK